MYAPNEAVFYHHWFRHYRPTFHKDNNYTDSIKIYTKNPKNSKKYIKKKEKDAYKRQIRRILFGDREYMRRMNKKFGIDFLGKSLSSKRTFNGIALDPYKFKNITKDKDVFAWVDFLDQMVLSLGESLPKIVD